MSEEKHQSCDDLRCMSYSVLQNETDGCDATGSGRKAADRRPARAPALSGAPSSYYCVGPWGKGVGLEGATRFLRRLTVEVKTIYSV